MTLHALFMNLAVIAVMVILIVIIFKSSGVKEAYKNDKDDFCNE